MAEQRPPGHKDQINPIRVVVKGIVLFIILNMAFITVNSSSLGRLSLYNLVFPGRERLPFGETPAESYNLSLFSLDAMLASHKIAGGEKPEGEYRVILIGDSSVWGTLLKPEQTLAGQLNQLDLRCGGRQIKVYNLGYPTISLTKDLMLLDLSMKYDPDLVLWPVTLESLPFDKQLSSPMVANNSLVVQDLINKYNLPLNVNDSQLIIPTWWDRTLIGQRRNMADMLRLQFYGVMWASTGIDQLYPPFKPAQTDFEKDLSFHDFVTQTLQEEKLAFPLLSAGIQAAGETPVMIINEPILISRGVNSDLRYNFFYPRWAYDQYRELMLEKSQQEKWNYLDLWNLVPAEEFTNSAIHLTLVGEKLMAEEVGRIILEKVCKK